MKRTDLQIRAAVPEDAPQLARIHVEGWRRTYVGIIDDDVLAAQSVARREGRWRADLADRGTSGFTVLATDAAGQVLGFAVGGRERSGHPDYDAELHALYVAYDQHRQGVGRQLVRAVAAELRARGYRAMLLWVFQANPAVGFYEALGGRRVAARDEQFGDRLLPEWGYGWDDWETLLGGA